MLAAASQGCELCALLLTTYEQTTYRNGSMAIVTRMEGSNIALAQGAHRLDTPAFLKFITRDHQSTSATALKKLDPIYEEVTKKAFEKRLEDHIQRQLCIIGVRLFMGTQTIGISLALFADESGQVPLLYTLIRPLTLLQVTPSSKRDSKVREASIGTDLNLACRWMQECCQNHNSDGCSLESIHHRLPTRVIEIGNTFDQVILLETNGQHGKFAALPHCWGKLPQWTTTTNHNKLPTYAKLPVTFQDAFTVTRKLGLKYLWIDALCILQDSVEDWEKECADMFKIYRNAEVTISVRDNPSSSATGFISSDGKSPYSSCDWNGLRISEQLSICVDPLWTLPPEIIDSRAWVLQERLLSRRMLHFSRSMLAWECSNSTYQDNFHYRLPLTSNPSRASKWELFHLERWDESWLYKYRFSIVQDYSHRTLTKPQDKFPALSGLASLFAKFFKSSYIAGLWEKRFVLTMCWEVEETEERTSDTPTTSWIAPSWSWASCQGIIHWDKRF
jgi:hypothetical protein